MLSRRNAIFSPLIAVLMLVGCVPSAAYIAADRATFRAVAPYLDREKLVQPDKAQEITDLQRSWEIRLEAAEGK